ncbi:MAG: ferrous iron transport protein A [Chitinophagia bacterium]|nr:ferrous iron transport protein A [Chitinophagia bacterium]
MGETLVKLSTLKAGSRATIHSQEDSAMLLTLLEMGFVPGEPLSVEMIAPLGDPIAVQIAGYFISIRKEDADKIWVLVG